MARTLRPVACVMVPAVPRASPRYVLRVRRSDHRGCHDFVVLRDRRALQLVRLAREHE